MCKSMFFTRKGAKVQKVQMQNTALDSGFKDSFGVLILANNCKRIILLILYIIIYNISKLIFELFWIISIIKLNP